MTPKQRMDAAQEFLRELAKGLPEDERVMAGYASEATVQTDESGKKLNAGFWPVPWKMGKYIPERDNCYVCISASIKTPNPKTGELRYWRGEASFGHGLCLMVDDIGTGKGSKGKMTLESVAAILKPTAVVETSPNNYQAFYFMKEPVADMVEFKAFLHSFVGSVLKNGGDHTIKDVARYGRMPIGVNNKRTSPNGPFKYADESGKPWQVRLHSADYDQRYTMKEIADAFGFKVVVPAKRVVSIENRSEYAMDDLWLRMAEKITDKAQMGEGSNGAVVMNMSGKYRIRCPWGDTHSNGDPYGAYFRGPIPGSDVEFVFGCAHDGCRKTFKRNWGVFVDEIIMPGIESDLEEAAQKFLAAGIYPGAPVSAWRRL